MRVHVHVVYIRYASALQSRSAHQPSCTHAVRCLSNIVTMYYTRDIPWALLVAAHSTTVARRPTPAIISCVCVCVCVCVGVGEDGGACVCSCAHCRQHISQQSQLRQGQVCHVAHGAGFSSSAQGLVSVKPKCAINMCLVANGAASRIARTPISCLPFFQCTMCLVARRREHAAAHT